MRITGEGSLRSLAAGTTPVGWLAAGTLTLLAEFEIWVEPIFQTGLPGPRPGLAALAPAAVLPLAWCRRFPLGALGVMLVALLAVGVVGESEQAAFELLLALLLGVFSVAAHADARRALLGAVLVVAGGVAYEWLTWVEEDTVVDVVVPYLLLAAAWAAGREVGHQRARATTLADRAVLLEEAREREAQLAVAGERTRIARELHDVVAHGISVMGLQAAAARRTLAPGHDAPREALLAVERVGRDSLAEMHRMLGVLRANGERSEHAPLPRLSHLPALVEEARAAGTGIHLGLEGDPRPLPPGVELSAYRILQEALTNVRKHAPGATAHVTVRYGTDALELIVVDDGSGASTRLGARHGLLGMRERAALHGGTLRARPGADGGFVVEARLLVDEP